VDDTLKTSVEDIFAAGDCIEVKYFITGKKGVFPFGSLANRQGRVVAENMAGNKVTFKGAVAAASVKVFDTVLAVCGMSETEAHRNGIECKSVIGLFSDRPDFHPDSKDITAVLVYEVGTLRLIGFQAIGQGEVTRLVDAFSILASKSATALDLLEFEHAYTPPHSPPMNVLNHLGSMAIAQETRNIKCMKISELSAFKGTIIDVRKPDEIAEYPLQQPSIHIPLHEIYMRKQEVPSSMPLLFVCQKGVRSHEAACSFKNAGWEDVSYLGGGILLKNSICHFQA
jgi:rhodanese-related sulfurtransferase